MLPVDCSLSNVNNGQIKDVFKKTDQLLVSQLYVHGYMVIWRKIPFSKTFSFFQEFPEFFRRIPKFQEFSRSFHVATLLWKILRYSLPLFSRNKATFNNLNIHLKTQAKSIPDKNPSNFDSPRHALVAVFVQK